MRHAALALFVLLPLASCADATLPFEVVVTNVGTEVSYINATEGSGILMGVQEEIDGEALSLSTSLAFMCAPKCSDPPGFGSIACADMAPDLLVTHALLPGDSASKSFDGEFWYFSEARGCVKRAPLTGPMSVRLCHDDTIVDFNGDLVDEATNSGPVGSGGFEVMLEEANCELFPVEIEGGVVDIEVVD